MNYWPLLGIALVVLGFALKFNPLMVVAVAAIVTGLLGGIEFVPVIEALGKAFNDNRYISVSYVILPVIALLSQAMRRTGWNSSAHIGRWLCFWT